MLKIGLTGGIASGKSVVAARLAELGALLVDSDVLAREVVEPGTPGLASVVAEFGPDILDDGGRLDRAALGAVVFADPARRAALNTIIHPLVRERAAALAASAGSEIVVQDIPLLVETGQGSGFHLVIVVDASEEVRIDRMTKLRGMSRDEARARIAAQVSRDERLQAADVVLDNSGAIETIRAQVDSLWNERIVPFARNLEAGVQAAGDGALVLVPADPDWPQEARRLGARLLGAAPGQILAVDHVGSTSVPGMAARDVLDLQLVVPDVVAADGMTHVLAAAGFPAATGGRTGPRHERERDLTGQVHRRHANADPGRPVNLEIRAAGSPGWRFALCFRDWLRADFDAAAAYHAEKKRLVELHEGSASAEGYTEAKESWIAGVAEPAMTEWAARTGWHPPSYAVRS